MMDFQKKNWEFNDIITEGELNRIEDGIEEGITIAENAQETANEANTKAEQNASDLTTLQNDFNAHQADYTTEIANRVKKDGDTITGYLAFRGYSGNGLFVENIANIHTGDISNGIKIKTNIPFNLSYTVNVYIKGGNSNINFYCLTFIPRETLFDSSNVVNMGTAKPEFTLAYEEGYVVIFINNMLFKYSSIIVSAQARYAAYLGDLNSWEIVVDEPISDTAIATTIVPYLV